MPEILNVPSGGQPQVTAKPAHLWHHFDDIEHQNETTTLGMWVFLATEVLIFGALFTGYASYRSWYFASFEAASRHLNVLIGGVNTIVLLTSSLTMALAVRSAQLGRRGALIALLILTALLGTVFLALKGVEYYSDYREKLVPGLAFDAEAWRHDSVNPGHVQLFLVFYYVMTGLHAVHLTIGIVIMAVLALMAWYRAFSPEYHTPVAMWGLYWHFVDIVWIFLLPLLYLVGTRSTFY
jgi:cytochrome c oxidase subunit III